MFLSPTFWLRTGPRYHFGQLSNQLIRAYFGPFTTLGRGDHLGKRRAVFRCMGFDFIFSARNEDPGSAHVCSDEALHILQGEQGRLILAVGEPGVSAHDREAKRFSVRPTVVTVNEPQGYDPESIEAQRDLVTIHSAGTVGLKLRLSPNLHNRLTENPLSDSQHMTQDQHGWTLECQLEDTQGLRLFLLSNAADIEVLAPLDLRMHVRETLREALDLYDRDLAVEAALAT